MQHLCNLGKLPEPFMDMSPRGWADVTMPLFLFRTDQCLKFGQRDACDEIKSMLPGLQQWSLEARAGTESCFYETVMWFESVF